MNTFSPFLRLILVGLVPLLTQCTTTQVKQTDRPLAIASQTPSTKVSSTKSVAATSSKAAVAADDLDEYAVVEIADPYEKLNRGIFKFNDKLYLIVFRPISKGYEKVLPKPLRNGINNAYENLEYPVRFVNCVLQGKFKHSGRETEKFIVNSIAGLGGVIRMSDKIAILADLPEQDTGLTFAKWGMGHGAYIVLPFFGPCSVRDTFGFAGDCALNPVNWGTYWKGNHDWTKIPPTVNSLRSLPPQLSQYDNAKQEAIDPYISTRSAYIQYRDAAAKK